MFSPHVKQIVLNVPKDKELPPIAEFTIEENLLMLQIGSDAILSSKRNLIETNVIDTIKAEIQRDFQKDMDVLNSQLKEGEQALLFQEKLTEIEANKVDEEVATRIALQIDKYECINKFHQEEIERLKEALQTVKEFSIPLREKS